MKSLDEPAYCIFRRQPLDPACFVGRATELRDLVSRASRGALVNLVGPGLIGRTSFLRYAREIYRTRAQQSDLLEGTSVIAPYVDLGTPRSLREVIVEAIVQDMRPDDRPPEHTLDGPAAVESLGNAMSRGSGPTRYVLLIDRAEYLLGDPAADNYWAQGGLDTLAMIQEAVENLSIVLAFGVSGPLAGLDAQLREEREREFLESASAFLSFSLERIELALVDDAALRAFAERATLTGPGGQATTLRPDEIDWLLEQAGGHPFLFQFVGMRLSERLMADARVRFDRDALAMALPEKVQPFVGRMMQRIRDHEGALAAARAVAELGGGDIDPHTAEILRGEALVTVTRNGGATATCTMRSALLRRAIARYSARYDAAAAVTKAPGGPLPPLTLAVGINGGRREARVTPAELELIRELRSGRLVSRDELRNALRGADGEPASDKQVTQRLSVLRKKIAVELGVEDAIENTYGTGYRLINPDRFQVSER